jgi:hypothetical protein
MAIVEVTVTVINGLAYYSAETKKTVKSILMKTLRLLYYNYFLICHPLIKFFILNLKIYIFIEVIQREGSSCCSNESDQGPML